ncbi:MAG: DUF222 domain-containing protein [Acidimicrobiales bacterium]|nr:DUF222 domain-containing protein [Acidimicrobiales bacterium]
MTSQLARCQYQLVTAAAAFAESPEWVLDGSPTPAHWLASVADVEECTAREWIRIGKALTELPVSADAFATRRLSYSKVRTLTRTATPENEAELVELIADVPASQVGKVIAAWANRNQSPEDIAARQRASRSVGWRTEPDGMVVFTMRLQPHIAAIVISVLTLLVMRSKNRREADGSYPSTTAQYADAVEELLDAGTGTIDTEVVFHVRSDGATCDDGTPVCDTIIAQLVPQSFLRVLIHDAERRPINASGRQRHPSVRQRRVVHERDRCCVDCGRHDLLEYDHVPDYQESRRTHVDELKLRCAPCHHTRHHPPTP